MSHDCFGDQIVDPPELTIASSPITSSGMLPSLTMGPGNTGDVSIQSGGNVFISAGSENQWGQVKIRNLDPECVTPHIDEYLGKNLHVDIVAWGENKITFQILIRDRVISEKTVDIDWRNEYVNI